MRTAIDTNVLLDLLVDDPQIASAAGRAIETALAAGPVIICSVVYAELAAGFASHKEVTEFIQDLQLRVEELATDTLFHAAVAWRRYVAHRGKHIQCPRCGRESIPHCPACKELLAWRQHIIPDFLVGAHAACQTDCLITRDTGYFRTYFPTLRLIDVISLSG